LNVFCAVPSVSKSEFCSIAFQLVGLAQFGESRQSRLELGFFFGLQFGPVPDQEPARAFEQLGDRRVGRGLQLAADFG